MADIFERVNKKVSELSNVTSTKQDLFALLDKQERWVANFIIQKGAVRSSDIAGHFKVDKKTAVNWLKAWEEKGVLKRKDISQKRYIQYILDDKFNK
jgi:DNA-binding MarR family transcriptional regulator